MEKKKKRNFKFSVVVKLEDNKEAIFSHEKILYHTNSIENTLNTGSDSDVDTLIKEIRDCYIESLRKIENYIQKSNNLLDENPEDNPLNTTVNV